MDIKVDDRYTMKDWFTCEKCQYVNILNVVKAPKRQKRQRMIWCDDFTWNLFKSMAGEFGWDHGRMLSFLVGRLQREKDEYETAIE